MSNERYRLDDLLIDLPRQRVERDAQLLEVAGLSFRLLHYLLLQQQRVVGFDELMQQVWAPAVVNEETVTQRVRLLRQALGDDGRNPRYLRSVRGQGYQLCAPPQRIELTASPRQLSMSPPRQRWIVGASLAVIVVAAASWHWWPAPARVSTSPLLQRAAYYAAIGQQDNNERAIVLYQQRLQEAPDDNEALAGLSRAYSARVCLFNGDQASAVQAESLARRVIAAQPDTAAGYAALAYSQDCRGQVDAALQGYEQALQRDPDADPSRASAAYLYERKGRLAEALAANLAVRDPARVRFLELQIASNLNLLGYVEAAESRYRRSFQLYPDNVYSNLAWPQFLLSHARYGEAQVALEQALQRGSAHAGLYLLQAELALQRGDGVAAAAASQHALALRPQASLPQTMAWLSAAEPLPAPAILRERAQRLLHGLDAGADAADGLEAALLLQAAGDPRAAPLALNQAISHGYRDGAYLRASPLLQRLRSAAGFADALAALEHRIVLEREQVRRHGRLPATIGSATP